ncbi:Major Facilitator Superfamily [Yersinia pekkanenii]|uniref:Major Facilitator Superfamily n=1 Tax=Yersinia pekkanenii TaxID=1288385 RepID=A0A0T9PT82_9GAMM|nr:Major Facilitator Superfamily [Yersinia pekkanenii]CRY67375.1 Major Facilitator Superfamily [Yersinia pekkanenii]
MILPALGAVLGGALLFAIAGSFSLMFMARLLAGIGTGALTGAANLALIRFCPPDGGKRAALIATLSFTVGLALGPVFSSLSLQANFHPTVVPFVLIIVMAFAAAVHFHSLLLAGMGMVVTGYTFGSIFVGSAALVNLISPKASHARLLSLFYVIAYTANWVPVLLGVIIDRSSLLMATNILFIVAAPVCLFLSVFIARADFPRN